MMVRGRHRALPYDLDRAIRLPGAADFDDDELFFRHPTLDRRPSGSYSVGVDGGPASER